MAIQVSAETGQLLVDRGGKAIRLKQEWLHLGIRMAPRTPYVVLVTLFPENMLRMNILPGRILQTSVKEFRLKVQVVKVVFREERKCNPVSLSTPRQVVNTTLYKLPGGHAQI
jgi:hypothetical protein